MDTTDRGIIFDSNGICNHCHSYWSMQKWAPNIDNFEAIERITNQIKSSSKGKYNCIVGLSGGIDSSYVTLLAYKYGLSPLIVHFDNGWDTPLAKQNVNNILKVTRFDKIEVSVDEAEFISIQRAYIEADVIDVEVPTDMAIINALNSVALKYNIKYILSGLNVATEFTMGKGWNYSKIDQANFNAIIKKNKCTTKTYPKFSPYQQLVFRVKDIQTINILQYIEYSTEKFCTELYNEFEWKNYPVKHGESIFTLFYQCYYLPQKFNVDKRKAHLSDMIRANCISRDEALGILSSPALSQKQLDEIVTYTISKLGYSAIDFDVIMHKKPIPHEKYSSSIYYGSIVDRSITFLLSKKKIISGLKVLHNKIHHLF